MTFAFEGVVVVLVAVHQFLGSVESVVSLLYIIRCGLVLGEELDVGFSRGIYHVLVQAVKHEDAVGHELRTGQYAQDQGYDPPPECTGTGTRVGRADGAYDGQQYQGRPHRPEIGQVFVSYLVEDHQGHAPEGG